MPSFIPCHKTFSETFIVEIHSGSKCKLVRIKMMETDYSKSCQ